MNLKEAKKLLKNFKIEYSSTGNQIIAQVPSGNIFVKEGSIVKLLLNE